jgi:hypothetical protein
MPGYFCIHHGRQETKPCPICYTERKAKGRVVGNRWTQIRKAVLLRYGNQCAAMDGHHRCPIYAPLEVHHIDGNAMNNDPSNLVPVCRPHHRKRQDDPNATYAEPVVPVMA